MTEADWLASTDPEKMLNLLRGQASDRKLRLFACACCRAIWHLLEDKRSQTGVEVAERYADGLADQKERARARTAALAPTNRRANPAAWTAFWAASFNAAESVANACTDAVEAAASSAAQAVPGDWTAQAAAWDIAHASATQTQALLLRDVFGNPFRQVDLDPAWLRWHDGTVAKLARAIYEENAFESLPILADALEEAGCEQPDLLAHCRASEKHVRGCWAVDLLLAKT